MMTVNEVSKLTGVSIRTLQYYDKIGLLKPTAYTESGYRKYDDTALEQQIELLTMKKEHLENLIAFARGIKGIGVKIVNFSAFDTRKIDEYANQAKEQWGTTKEYREFEEKAKGRTKEEDQALSEEFMEFFVRFGQMKELEPSCEKVQNQVKAMQNFMTEHFYQCTNEILSCLGRMYNGGGDMTTNIDEAGGAGTADFTAEAIRIYCEKQNKD